MDYQLFSWLNNLADQSVWRDRLFVFGAEYLPVLMVTVFVGLVLWSGKTWREKRYDAALAFIAAGIGRGVITTIVRFAYYRPRPFLAHQVYQLLSNDGAGSFPSGHAAFFFAFALAIYMVNKKWGTWFILGAVIMGICRVIVGVHYPSDIVGGALVGALSVYLSVLILRNERVRRLLAL